MVKFKTKNNQAFSDARWVNRKHPHLPRIMTAFGFMIVTAIAHQGVAEDVTFLSGRILLLATLLAGCEND